MIPTWVLVVFILGVNFTFWAAIGLLRFTGSGLHQLRVKTARATRRARRPTPTAPPHTGTGQGDSATPSSRIPPPRGAGCRPLSRADAAVLMAADYSDVDAMDASLKPTVAPPHAGPHHVGTGQGAPATASSFGECRRPLAIADVAVLMAAHNEEVVIGDSLRAIISLVPVENVHVVSDFSSDRTVEVARRYGANVIETATNVGKAGALAEGIRRFGLTDRFGAVLLLDADTRLDPGYFTAALPLFDDPSISAVAGCAHSHWRTTGVSPMGRLLTAHRSRVYALTQRLLKYGQTWGPTNATHIVPGFASLYRTDVLTEITINPPGLVIEDFNMTFEVYRKKLGRVGFSLEAIAVTQDPDNLHDYIRQTKRWALGLWQTVRRHRLRPGLFSAMLSLLLLELLSASLLFVLLPVLVAVLAIPDVIPATLDWSWVSAVHSGVAAHLSLHTILIGVFLPDYLLTCAVAAVERQPRYLGYGLLFVFVRTIDAAIALYTLPRAWLEKSSGRWVSPTRRDPASTASTSTR